MKIESKYLKPKELSKKKRREKIKKQISKYYPERDVEERDLPRQHLSELP